MVLQGLRVVRDQGADGGPGKQRSKIWQISPDKPYKLVYCEDPWGNIVEVYTHSYEQIWSNLG